LATVKATNLAGKNNYRFIDANITDKVLFYRLKQVDIDGRFTYAAIVKINRNSNIKLSVYPNPASTTMVIKNINPAALDLVQVISSDGKLLIQQKVTVDMQVNIKKLTPGIYILRLTRQDKTIQSFSFSKQ
jgi:hypothetical protein